MTAGRWGMTLADALARQAAQIEHYGPRFAGGVDALRARVESVTDTAGCDLSVMRDIGEVNRRVPRGVHIENICGISGCGYD